MLQLDWLADDGLALRNPDTLRRQLTLLKKAAVTGVMADVWWSLCEPEPGQYRFGGVLALCQVLAELGLKLQATMAFHKCGGNVGDVVDFPLPTWALGPAREQGLLYRSRTGVFSEDCLSLSADAAPIFPTHDGSRRTALMCYKDYVSAFAGQMKAYLGQTLVELQVGMGPCGELRYPSYMMSNGWQYPGVGLVMAHDAGMLRMLRGATSLKDPPWMLPEDQNAGPEDCSLFRAEEELFRRGDGKVFLEWYSKVLLRHGEAMLDAACDALKEQQIEARTLELSVKISGLHWHTMHPSRATEACAGYDCCSNTRADAYCDIAAMLAAIAKKTSRPVTFNFTCLEMNNWSNSMPHAQSAPEDLIAQVRRACVAHSLPLAGENALEFDLATGSWAFEQMNKQLRGWSLSCDRMHALTLLRLNERFVSDEALEQLGKFVSST